MKTLESVRETSPLFPLDLLDDLVLTDAGRQWWAVHTRPRQEKALARQLESLEVPYYLPLVRQQSLWRGRPVVLQLPLFGGYVFVFGDEEERVRTLTTQRTSRILHAGAVAAVTRDLLNVRALIESGAPLTIEARLEPGRRVRVRHGALAGMEGIIVARRGRHRLLVEVRFLQQQVSVQIDDFQVEPV